MREGLQKIVSLDETIAAISTPPGRSALGIVRISGPAALLIVSRLFRCDSPVEHRRALVGNWVDVNGEPLDHVVLTFAAKPNSYTGEDLVEISAHGNPIVLYRILQSAFHAGARMATPGEFTLRAVANGKLDLMQAEAIHEFVQAQTEQQARTQLRQIEGVASKKVAPIQSGLVDLIAHMEAGIDFAEDDVDVVQKEVVEKQLASILKRLETVQSTFDYGRLLVEGLRVTIVGKPNVGKSSLFNRLLRSDRAIVTEIPGTTRDVLTEPISLNGVPLRISDTAGIRETQDRVEAIGVSRSLEMMSDCDVTIVVLDGSSPMGDEDESILRRAQRQAHVVAVNKADLAKAFELSSNGARVVRVSALTGAGMEDLEAALGAFIAERKADASDDFVLTSARQNQALLRAMDGVSAAGKAVAKDVPHEMILLDLYASLSALNEMTGEVVTEDILDKIFSSFCIGK
jgi:tRNA modification GTPase